MKHCEDCLGRWPFDSVLRKVPEGIYYLGGTHVLHLEDEDFICEGDSVFVLWKLKERLAKL